MLSLEMMHGWLIRPVNHTCALRTRSTDDNNGDDDGDGDNDDDDDVDDDDNVTMQMTHCWLIRYLCSPPPPQNKVNR